MFMLFNFKKYNKSKNRIALRNKITNKILNLDLAKNELSESESKNVKNNYIRLRNKSDLLDQSQWDDIYDLLSMQDYIFMSCPMKTLFIEKVSVYIMTQITDGNVTPEVIEYIESLTYKP